MKKDYFSLFACLLLSQLVVAQTGFKPGKIARSISVSTNFVTNRVTEPFVAEDARFVSEIEVRKINSNAGGTGFSARYTNTISMTPYVSLDIGTGLNYTPHMANYRWGIYEDNQLMVYDRADHYKNLYVAVPINVKVHLFKQYLTLDLGFQMMVNAIQLNTRTETKTQFQRDANRVLVPLRTIFTDQTDKFQISSFDFGVFSGAEVKLTDRFSLGGRYYYNFNRLVRLYPLVSTAYTEATVRYYLNRF